MKSATPGVSNTLRVRSGLVSAKRVKDASVFPVIVGSAVKEIGIDRLVDFITEIGPAPEQSDETKEEPEIQIFKTFADPFMGKLSLAKVAPIGHSLLDPFFYCRNEISWNRSANYFV